MNERVTVELGERRYDIRIGDGLLAGAGALLSPLLQRPFVVVVTDENVAGLHLPTLVASLEASGIEHHAIVLPPGEATKSFDELARLVDRLLALEVGRRDHVVALGGGVIGDLAGFAASIVRRGVGYVQAPTTLLAQIDSAVGGKTAIDTARGKNLVGSFYQPGLVIADVGTLKTLPRRQRLAGYGEMVKYGLIGDRDFFEWLEANGRAIVEGDAERQAESVARCCRMKAAIVARDEREEGERALLNLGHTFGHALEAETGYGDALLHGEAVALGTVIAFDLSVRLGHCPAADAERVRRHFAAVGLPTSLRQAGLSSLSRERLLAHMRQDKKVQAGRLAFILVRGVGDAFVSRDVATNDLEAQIDDALAG